MSHHETHENTKRTKKSFVRSVFRVFRVFAFSWLAVASLRVSAQAPSVPTGDVAKGKELYLKYSCYACHGYDGHGGAGARLVPFRMNQSGFTIYLHNPPRPQMPPYSASVVPDAQAADLFAYIKSLPESPAAKDIPLLMRIINESKPSK
jgi:mono/diheme cytochrome c family protein